MNVQSRQLSFCIWNQIPHNLLVVWWRRHSIFFFFFVVVLAFGKRKTISPKGIDFRKLWNTKLTFTHKKRIRTRERLPRSESTELFHSIFFSKNEKCLDARACIEELTDIIFFLLLHTSIQNFLCDCSFGKHESSAAAITNRSPGTIAAAETVRNASCR